MSETIADSNRSPLVDGPSSHSAANDLRAAAEGRELTPTEAKALNLKEAAAQKAGQLRDLAGEKALGLKSAAGEKIGALREGAEETALNLRSAASDQWQDTRLKVREAHLSAEDYVRANPTKAVLTAAGIGFVLGLLSRR